MNDEFHEATKILAIYVNGENKIFNSIGEACDYYNGMGARLFREQLRRILEGHGLWEYEEKYTTPDGETKTKKVQVCFDMLLE